MCYQVPSMMQDGICLVISPLIDLMKDQVSSLQGKGIKAIALNSGMTLSEVDIALDNCIYGGYKFLYVSPERLQNKMVQERLKKCISILLLLMKRTVFQNGATILDRLISK